MKILDNIKKNTYILLAITIIILYVVIKDDLNSIIATFKSINIIYLLIAFLLIIVSIFFKGLMNYIMVNDKKKIDLKESMKHAFIVQFFNGITPFSTGGQPMEVYMITEHNIELSRATSCTIQSFIFYQIALVLLGTIAVVYNKIFNLFPKIPLLQDLVLLGFVINILVIVALLFISYSKKLNKKLRKITNKFFNKLGQKEKSEEIEKKYEEFYNSFQQLRKNKKLFATGIFINIMQLLSLYIIPIFLVLGLNIQSNINVIDTITSSAYVYLIGAFVPVPGASGGIEYGFTQFYGNFININNIAAILIVWRFVTYYFGIIVGGLLFAIDKKVKK